MTPHIHRISMEVVSRRSRVGFMMAILSLALGWGLYGLEPMHATPERRQALWGICFTLLAINLGWGWFHHHWMRRARHLVVSIEPDRLLLHNERTLRETALPLDPTTKAWIKRRGGRTLQVRLKTGEGRSVTLQDYDDMDLLAENLGRKLGRGNVGEE